MFITARDQQQIALESQMEIDIGRAIHTVTKALDYVGIDDKSYGRRVGLICHRISHFLGWDRDRRHYILLAGMLHDCGVSSTGTHQKLIEELEWSGAEDHCLRGEEFLNSFGPFSDFALPIRYHHTRWENFPDTVAQEVKEHANLIFLADRLDVQYALYSLSEVRENVLVNREAILDGLADFVGSLFSPEFFEAAKKAIKRDSFWLELRDEYLDQAIFETLDTINHKQTLSFDEIESFGEFISQIVDAKSPFTHYHSLRVADLAFALSGYLDYPLQIRKALRIAGLLHDVGKLRTPDEVLEKNSKLSELEMITMKSHPMDSKKVLAAIFPKSLITQWASHHHEKLNGMGYPFGWEGDQIDEPTRILTIVDIFQALAQKRPYREKMPLENILVIMDQMADRGEIDSRILSVLKSHDSDLYEIATKTTD